jgi:hypothetical protein
MSAEAISLREWVETLSENGHNISFEFHVLEIDGGSVRVCPVIRAGSIPIWQGQEDVLVPNSAMSLAGFEMDGADLVLKDFGEYV